MKRLKKGQRRQRRVRAKIKGKIQRPRLSVYRSSRYISAQIIDDEKRKTLLGVHEKSMQFDTKKLTKTEKSLKLGEYLAQEAIKKGIKKVVFDRGRYHYQGRVKALAEGARKGGLRF